VCLLFGARSILSLSKDAQKGFFDKLRMPFCTEAGYPAQFAPNYKRTLP
jgi:hypothetical protein